MDKKGIWAEWKQKDEEYGVLPPPKKRTAIWSKKKAVLTQEEQPSIMGYFQPVVGSVLDVAAHKQAQQVSDVSGGEVQVTTPKAPVDITMADLEEDVNMVPLHEDEDEEITLLGGTALPAHAPPPVSLATQILDLMHILMSASSAATGTLMIPTTSPKGTGRTAGSQPLSHFLHPPRWRHPPT